MKQRFSTFSKIFPKIEFYSTSSVFSNMEEEEKPCFLIKENILPKYLLKEGEIVTFIPKGRNYIYALSEENLGNALSYLFDMHLIKIPFRENFMILTDKNSLILLQIGEKRMLDINFEYFDVIFECIPVSRKIYFINESCEEESDLLDFLKLLGKYGYVVGVDEVCKRLAESEDLIIIDGCDYSPDFLDKTLYKR